MAECRCPSYQLMLRGLWDVESSSWRLVCPHFSSLSGEEAPRYHLALPPSGLLRLSPRSWEVLRQPRGGRRQPGPWLRKRAAICSLSLNIKATAAFYSQYQFSFPGDKHSGGVVELKGERQDHRKAERTVAGSRAGGNTLILPGLLVHVPDEACSCYFKEAMALNPSTAPIEEVLHLQSPSVPSGVSA